MFGPIFGTRLLRGLHAQVILAVVMAVVSVGLSQPSSAAATEQGTITSTNLLTNGGFESGASIPPGNLTLAAGSTDIAGWTVSQGDIDYVGDGRWEASEGTRSLDLNGFEAGGIKQTFTTVAGASYLVSLDMAGNPEWDPPQKTMTVKASGQSTTFTFDTSGKSRSVMGWENRTWTFTAASESTTLEFESATSGSYGGPTLDNVSVHTSTTPRTIMAGDRNIIVPTDQNRRPKAATDSTGVCTAGFAVTKNSTRYMLTTNHCREWTRETLLGTKGMGIYADFISVWDVNNRMQHFTYAASINCGGSGTDSCLRPPLDSVPDDILAWRPDPGAALPIAQVRTGQGILPVLGAANWKHGDWVCYFGYAPGYGREKCGKVGGFDQGRKLVWIDEGGGGHTEPGDSGGPVYKYSYGQDGKPIGVWAVGITKDYGMRSGFTKVTSKTGMALRTFFMPIATVKRLLGVEVLVGP